jgi:hypothetical protein
MIISRVDHVAGNDDRFSTGLQKFAKSNKVKDKCLLKSLLVFNANIVDNLKAKDYGYDDIARKLEKYMPMRQKSKKESKTNEGILEYLVILKTDKKWDISKECHYCKTNG